MPQGAAEGVPSPGLRRGLRRGQRRSSRRQPGATGSATRRAGPGLTGRPRGGPSSRPAAALDRGSSEQRRSRPPGCGRGPGGPGAAPAWPRYLPAPRRSPAPSWSGGGSGAARGRPPPARGPQRGRGGRGPGPEGSCSTRGAAQRHCHRPHRPGGDRPAAAPALFGLPVRPRRPRPPAHDQLCRAGLTAPPAALTERVGGTPRSAPIGCRTGSPNQ